MSQQINLFNPALQQQKQHFSALTMMQALALVVAGSFAVSAFTSHQVQRLRNEADNTSAQLAYVQTQFKKIDAASGAIGKDKKLEDDIRRAESEVKGLQQVFSILERGDFGNTSGYAEYMKAFARQTVEGVWLTGLTIYGAGNEIALRGRALQPERIPVYISGLKREAVLRGKSFATLDVHHPEAQDAQPAYVEFKLESSGIVNEQPLPAARAR